MFSCYNNHTFETAAMPNDHDNYDHTSGRCPDCDGEIFEIEDGVMQAIDPQTAIMHDYDATNSLLQKEDRVSTAFNEFAKTSALIFVLLLLGAMIALSLPPDERLSVRVGNDAEVQYVR